ncbi:scarecrow-like protein 3 [Salvia divinorum]|uniref:Scarecrow-like protein 3 n=1 Tax=Salvia divinorum TaxID=28513 RepID=A0ABD1GQD8_SALDI
MFPAEESADQTSSTEATIRVVAERFIHSTRVIKNPGPNHSHCGEDSFPVQRKCPAINPVEPVLFPNINLFISFQKEHLLAQDLASRPVQRLRIAAVGTRCRPIIEETCSQLACFTRSLNIEFSFNVVMVAGDLSDLNTTLLDASANETVVVYSSYVLANLVGRVEQLDHLMLVLRGSGSSAVAKTQQRNGTSRIFIPVTVSACFTNSLKQSRDVRVEEQNCTKPILSQAKG